ncbi:hypothetical protein ACWEO4_00695 [Streptomyces sp. NPDC004393]|uniref:MarR family winged helix-turn-helix transcriptional regulator n=1 Tax=Streptomyces sp. NPDC004533 TaxID=3154278 RepID=UPI0033BAABE5
MGLAKTAKAFDVPVVLPVLSALGQGYEVHVVADASGGTYGLGVVTPSPSSAPTPPADPPTWSPTRDRVVRAGDQPDPAAPGKHPRRPRVEKAMENEATGPQDAAPPSPADGDDDRNDDLGIDHELLHGWKLVEEGFLATHESLASELGERFDLGKGSADVLMRLLIAPERRMPMTRLAHEAGMSSGGFTKLADRLCGADLARRVSCEEDRRVIYLELTTDGQDTARAISLTATRLLRARVLTALGDDGFRALTEAMRALRDANRGSAE